MCRRALASNGEMRTRRCTPISDCSRPYAFSPFTSKVTDLMPAPSPSRRSVITVPKPWRSAHRRYMRSSISAQSWLSVPPAPGWMVTMALRASFSPESSIAVSTCSRTSEKDFRLALDIAARRLRLRGPARTAYRGRRSSAAMRWSSAMACSSRLRSCMTFWLFSGCDQKSGREICSSNLSIWDFFLGTSKIAPHGQSLFAERGIFSFEFV